MAIDVDSVVTKRYTVKSIPHNFFQCLEDGKQHVLWIGCSDSWITETDRLGLSREEIFVHRNLANVVSNGDLSSSSAIEYCVAHLKVKHIVICGHYDCGLVRADQGPEALHGWYSHLSKLHRANEVYLRNSDMTEVERNHRLVEVYVLAEAEWLKGQPIVEKALKDRGLEVHAFVFDKNYSSCVILDEVSSKDTT